MVKGASVIDRGFIHGTLYKLDACIVEYNSTFVKIKFVEEVRVSPSADGHGFCVPKGALSYESKLPTEKTMLWH